jgi:hypothetical protein
MRLSPKRASSKAEHFYALHDFRLPPRCQRFALFWDNTHRWVVVLYRRFGITYWSHLQGSRSPRRKGLSRI